MSAAKITISSPVISLSFSAIVALVMFVNMARERAYVLHGLLPQVFPSKSTVDVLGQGLQHPIVPVVMAAPLFFALAIPCLILFWNSARTGVNGTFGGHSLSRLRLAGILIGLGVLADLALPYLAWSPFIDVTFPAPSAVEIYPLMFVAAVLSTLSCNGNILFRHAQKLRSDLDEIV